VHEGQVDLGDEITDALRTAGRELEAAFKTAGEEIEKTFRELRGEFAERNGPYCVRCGRRNPQRASFCFSCGHEIPRVADS